MKLHDFKILQSENCLTRVFIDGVEMSGVQSVDYSSDTNFVPTVTLKILAGSLNTETEEK